jgi:hypothetical protein
MCIGLLLTKKAGETACIESDNYIVQFFVQFCISLASCRFLFSLQAICVWRKNREFLRQIFLSKETAKINATMQPKNKKRKLARCCEIEIKRRNATSFMLFYKIVEF